MPSLSSSSLPRNLFVIHSISMFPLLRYGHEIPAAPPTKRRPLQFSIVVAAHISYPIRHRVRRSGHQPMSFPLTKPKKNVWGLYKNKIYTYLRTRYITWNSEDEIESTVNNMLQEEVEEVVIRRYYNSDASKINFRTRGALEGCSIPTLLAFAHH